MGYFNGTVCHINEFATEFGINTQGVKSFNICIKLQIKSQKGIKKSSREDFKGSCVIITTIRKIL
jgi:hypothetical protein